MPLPCRIQGKDKQNDQPQEQRSSELFSPSCKQVHPHHEQRKGCQQVMENLLRDPLIDTSIGFPVVLLHDLRHVVCRAHFHIVVDSRFDFRLGNHSFLVLKVCQIVRLLVYYFSLTGTGGCLHLSAFSLVLGTFWDRNGPVKGKKRLQRPKRQLQPQKIWYPFPHVPGWGDVVVS